MDLSAKQDSLLELGRSFGEKLATIKARRTDISWYPYNSIANVGILSRFLPIEMLEWVEDGGGRSVVDIGSADGDVAYFLESRGWKAHAIDNPPTNNYQCKGIEALRDELSSAVRVDLMDIDRPFELDRQYDLALALGILYHLRNPFAFLMSIALHSKRLILSTRVARQTKDGLNYSAVPGAYLLAPRECNNDPTNFWIFTPNGLERLLGRCGWRIVAKFEAGNTVDSNPIDSDKDERHFVYCERVKNWHDLNMHTDF